MDDEAGCAPRASRGWDGHLYQRVSCVRGLSPHSERAQVAGCRTRTGISQRSSHAGDRISGDRGQAVDLGEESPNLTSGNGVLQDVIRNPLENCAAMAYAPGSTKDTFQVAVHPKSVPA